MDRAPSFVSLLIVVFLAFLVPLLLSRFRRFKLPIVVGEILVGIVIGRSGFGLIRNNDPLLELLAELGFVFLMFLSGIEIDFSNLGLPASRRNPSKKRSWGPLPLGALNLGLTLAISVGLGLAFARFGLVRNPWMMALILSTTSLGVVMPVLKESGSISGRYGQTLLVTALLADFATMLLITVLVAILSSGLTFDILLIGVLFVAFFILYSFGRMLFNRIPGVRRTIQELSHASAQIKVRAAFTLMLMFVALSEFLGTEVILGAFLAGAVISLIRTPEDTDLGNKLEAIGFGFFIPIFFIMVGVTFDFSVLLASPQAMVLLPLLLLAAIAVKLLPALVFRLGFPWRESLAGGVLLSSRLSLIIAASAIGPRLGVISEPVNAAIILVAILSVTFAPPIFARLAPQSARNEKSIIVAGEGELALRVAGRLREHGEPVVIVSTEPGDIQLAGERGIQAVQADLASVDPAAAPYLSEARALICTSADAKRNYRMCEFLRTTYGVENIVVQVSNPQEQERFRRMGAVTFNPVLDRVAIFSLLGRNPDLYRLLTEVDDDQEAVEVTVRNQDYIGRALKNIDLPGGLLVLGIRREGEFLVPHGNTQLHAGDRLTLLGSMEAVKQARRSITNTTDH